MTAQKVSDAEAQWREQYASMREAIENLQLQPPNAPTDDSLDDLDFDNPPSSREEQDVWDFISDDEDEGEDDVGFYQEDDALDGKIDGEVPAYGVEWLTMRCSGLAAKNGLDTDVLQTQILDLLRSGRPEEELQSSLTDLVGFDDLDLIIELLAHRADLTASAASLGGGQSGSRLLTKAEREEALRRQDYEHKSQGLAGPSARDPQYPHVYKAHDAGNMLDQSGNKYGLPLGSERLEFEKYEEYKIPAAKKGTLKPGQSLVDIKDMDRLCQNTFKGYKSLNRMQSLVYPVAYKSSENMLICAPTGAVSSLLMWPLVARRGANRVTG
ncbi:hypothetical protein IMZ48_06705 [Candidatus Bathyarchaeota archaeon]|nr:hypothetical protein [Candidatus Bathyarchaeota archaeon]